MTQAVKKGRKSLSDNRSVSEVNETEFNEATETARQVALTQHDQEKNDVFGVGKLLGRMEAADFMAKIANSVLIKTYEDVKKSKAWRYLSNPNSGENRQFESLDEFCEVCLGKSYKRLREMSLNMRLLGEEAYEQAEHLGLRQVDYNAIKALPAPDQELIRQAVEDAQSKDEVLTVLQELAAKHARERQELEAEISDAKAELQSKNELLDKRNKTIERLEIDNSRIKKLPPDQAQEEMLQELASHHNTIEAMLRGTYRWGFKTLMEHAEQNDTDCRMVLAGFLGQLKNDLQNIQDEFSLPDHGAGEEPEWITEAKAKGLMPQ